MIGLQKNPHLRIVLDVALVLEENLKLVHPVVKFYRKILPNISQAGRLKHFYKAENLEQGTQIF